MEPLQSWLDAKAVRRMAEDLMAPAADVDEPVVDAGYGDAFEGFAATAPIHEAGSVQIDHQADPVALARKVEPNEIAPPTQPADASEAESVESAVVESAVVTPPIAKQPPAKEDPQPAFQPAMHLDQESPAIEFEVSSDASGEFDDTGKQTESSVIEGGSAAGPQAGLRGPFLSRVQQFSETIRRDLGAQAMFLIDNEGQIILDELENAKLVRVARILANASDRTNRQTDGAVVVGNLHIKIDAGTTLEVIPVQSRYGLLILGVIFPAPIGNTVSQLAEELFRTVEPD